MRLGLRFSDIFNEQNNPCESVKVEYKASYLSGVFEIKWDDKRKREDAGIVAKWPRLKKGYALVCRFNTIKPQRVVLPEAFSKADFNGDKKMANFMLAKGIFKPRRIMKFKRVIDEVNDRYSYDPDKDTSLDQMVVIKNKRELDELLHAGSNAVQDGRFALYQVPKVDLFAMT